MTRQTFPGVRLIRLELRALSVSGHAIGLTIRIALGGQRGYPNGESNQSIERCLGTVRGEAYLAGFQRSARTSATNAPALWVPIMINGEAAMKARQCASRRSSCLRTARSIGSS